MKIVVAEKIAAAALDLLRSHSDWQIVTPDSVGSNLKAQLADADALIVRSAIDVNEELLGPANQLRVVGRAGVGVDNVDLNAATRKGIAVMNTPGANSVAVAEQTIGMMIALARQLTRADRLMHAGKWEKKSLQGSELRGKTLGIVGLGRIGMEVARRALAFQMPVVAYDPYVSPAAMEIEDAAIRLAPLDEVLATADYLTLHVALSAETNGMINAAALQKMKKGIRLVNCARGELVDEAALAEGLKNGHVAGAALDVFQQEPLRESPLTACENVLLTPHIAGSTEEALEAVGVQIAQQVIAFLTQGVIQNAVNVPSVSHEEYRELQPYIGLAERLGAFLAEIVGGRPEEITMRYAGRIGSWKTDLIRNAAIAGVLNRVLAERANLVNAAAIAESRHIRVAESCKTRSESGGAADVLTLRLKTTDGEQTARGSVLHGNSPRLLALNGIDIEARLEQNLIYLRNRDVPGVVGQVGLTLARHGVNIANFSLGRAEEGASPRQAIGVVRVDDAVDDAVLQELREIPAVEEARAIRLP